MKNTDVTKKFQMRLEDLITHQMDGSSEKLSQSKIAREIGIEKGSLSKYLNDQAEIGINGLCKIADYFGVTTDYLLGRSDAYTSEIDIQTTCATLGLDQYTVETIRGFNPEVKHILSCLLAFEPFRQILWDMQELAGLYMAKRFLEEKASSGDFTCALANMRIVPDKLGFAEYKINLGLQETVSQIAANVSSHEIEEYAVATFKQWAQQAREQYQKGRTTDERGEADKS